MSDDNSKAARAKRSAARAVAAKLTTQSPAEQRIDDFQPLTTAENALLEHAISGETLIVSDEVPQTATKTNTIRAEFLRHLLLNSDGEQLKIHERGISACGLFIACEGGTEKRNFDLEGCQLTTNIELTDCKFDGLVNFKNTNAGTVSLEGSSLEQLNADGLVTKGNLNLEKVLIAGEVLLANSRIGGNLNCSHAQFSHNDRALFANRIVVEGNVQLGPSMRAIGQVSFANATVKGNLSANGSALQGKPCLNLRNTEIGGTLTWREMTSAPGSLDLSGASCNVLNMDTASWQMPQEIRMQNFRYETFGELPSNANSEFWCNWLEKQPTAHLNEKFRPKPFDYLAGVLDSMGYTEEATSVRIRNEALKTRFMRKYEPRPSGSFERLNRWLNVAWRWTTGWLIDYGYRPGKAALYLILVGLTGTLVYWWAANAGIMTPSHPLIFKEAHAEGGLIPKRCAENWVHFPQDIEDECKAKMPSEYSEFSPLFYSFDVLLPIVNLRQEVDWAPRVVHHNGSNWFAGRMVRMWEWFEIIAGWLLSLLMVSAIGGIIRR